MAAGDITSPFAPLDPFPERVTNVIEAKMAPNADTPIDLVFTDINLVGEETGRLDDMLMQVAETYDREVEVAIRKAMALLQPMMIVLMAVIIGFIIVSILAAMLSIYDLPV